jgi:hypothetical protein
MMNQRDLIALAMASQQTTPVMPPQRPPIARPFMPPQVPVRSLSPTMIGTPPAVQQQAATDVFGQALRNADPTDTSTSDAVGKALRKYFTAADGSGSAAP